MIFSILVSIQFLENRIFNEKKLSFVLVVLKVNFQSISHLNVNYSGLVPIFNRSFLHFLSWYSQII